LQRKSHCGHFASKELAQTLANFIADRAAMRTIDLKWIFSAQCPFLQGFLAEAISFNFKGPTAICGAFVRQALRIINRVPNFGCARTTSNEASGYARVNFSVLKSHSYKITVPPNDLAPVNVVKVIESQFKIQGKHVEVMQPNSCAALCYIPDVAGKYAALLIEKQQRAFRDRRPGDGSSFNH
jgi:hypothetical protein